MAAATAPRLGADGKADLSLSSFFQREEDLGRDRAVISLYRQTAPRTLNPQFGVIAGVQAETVGRYRLAQPAATAGLTEASVMMAADNNRDAAAYTRPIQTMSRHNYVPVARPAAAEALRRELFRPTM
jgi:hypothetical protein